MNKPDTKTFAPHVTDMFHAFREYIQNKPEHKPEKWLEQEILPLMLQLVPGMAVVLDVHENAYVYVSAYAEEVTGYTREELLEGGIQQALELFPPMHRQIITGEISPLISRHFEQSAANGDYQSARASYQSQLMHRNGTIRWYLHTLRIIKLDAQQRPHVILKMLTDIQEVKTDPYLHVSISRKNKEGKTEILFAEKYLPAAAFDLLSERETEVLHLICRGFTNARIAEQLFISIHTVQTHRKNILRKTCCKGTAELAAFALTGKTAGRLA